MMASSTFEHVDCATIMLIYSLSLAITILSVINFATQMASGQSLT